MAGLRRSIRHSLFLSTSLALALPFVGAQDADAVIVDRLVAPFDSTPVNVTAPTDDPGWHNTPTTKSGIYLGNQWFLSAKHVGFGNSTNTVSLPGGAYDIIPNSEVIITNPSSWRGQALSANSDLALYRINTNSTAGATFGLTPEQADPNVKSITIASSEPTLGAEVLLIGDGSGRPVNTSDPFGHRHWNSQWQLEDPGVFHGFWPLGGNRKTWGTNRVASDSGVESSVDAGNDTVIDIFGRDTIAQVTRFGSTEYDNPGVDNPTTHEAQASAGDSGGPVFYKDGAGDWVLAGVLHGIYLEDNQPENRVVFGNHSAFSVLSNPTYRNQITSLLADNSYSVMGDVNLDGSVDTDDLFAFAQGWDHSQAIGDIVSWKSGDLDQNGETNLADFALLRAALGGTVSTADLQALLNVTVVPEPTSVALALGGLGMLMLRRRQ